MTAPAAATREATQPALAGVRIADFSRVLIGPYCTRLLGTLGAEVIRVEWRRRPDQFRRFEPYLGERSVNTSGVFHGLNYSKKSLELDLTKPWGVETGLDLIARSDVVIENFRPGQFAEMGFTRERIRAANPEAIYLSVGGLGQEGPDSPFVAYGNSLHAYSGIVAHTGYPGEEGQGIAGTWADPVSGYFACLVLLAALHERRQHGPRFHYIDQSMHDCLVTTLAPVVIAAQLEPASVAPAGNRSRRHTPQGVLPCLPLGDDGDPAWVAFSVESYDQFRRLVSLAGLDGYDNPALFSVAARRRIEDELLAGLAMWSRRLDAELVARRLRETGVPAGRVSTAAEIAHHPEHAARRFLQPVPMQTGGTKRHMGVPWTTSHPDALVYGPPPDLGGDTRAVLREVLGRDDAEIAAIERRLEGS